MTTLPFTRALAARRAILRWAWRMFRREWRQQLLVLSLLAVAVLAAVTSVAVVHGIAVPNEATFGDASARIVLDASDPAPVAADLAVLERHFGTVEVIGQRYARVPGTAAQLELRYQDPRGAFGATMLALRDGRYPVRSHEIAVTDGVASTVGLATGDVLTLDDGSSLTVVGVVENPHLLDDEFALLPPWTPEPAGAGALDSVIALVDADVADVVRVSGLLRAGSGFSVPPNEPLNVTIGLLLVTAIGLVLVSLIAGASFAVTAARRRRHLGMLAATGATRRHLRMVTIAHGALVGAVASAVGTGAALVGWLLLAPRLETVAGHRIDPLDLPWWAVVACLAMANVTATGAAWWPARALSRMPVMDALSGRPPRPRPVRRSGLAAVVLLGLGIALLRYADHARPRTDPAALHTPPYWEFALLSGVLATIIGVLLVSPLAIRLLAAAGNRAPLAVRLALRDLGRYRSRSASALAAVTLGLAAAVFFVVTAAAAAADEDNLSERHVMVWLEGAPDLVPDLAPDRFAAATAAVDRLAAALGGAAVVPLEVAVTPDAGATADPAEDGDRLPPVRAAWRAADDDRPRSEPLYVATPALLAHYGAEGTARRGGADVLTVHSGRITLLTPAGPDHPESHPSTARLDVPPYASLPRTLITKEALDRRGWTARPAGWLVETAAPVSKGQLAAIRNLAAGAGLTVEVRRDRPDLTVTAWALTGAATVLALGILAMTVAILRSEAGRDLRVLVATGAGVRMQRAVTATVAGSLALAGALLGAGCAYLVAGPANPGGDLTQVPVAHLTTVILGVPALAAAAGWLLSGREPPALARPALE